MGKIKEIEFEINSLPVQWKSREEEIPVINIVEVGITCFDYGMQSKSHCNGLDIL